MTAKLYLADFEVESHACLAENVEPICSVIPERELEIHVSNLDTTPGTDRPLLSVQIIFPADSLETAKEKAKPVLKEYLNHLCFASNLPLRIHNLIRVVDWTKGLKERDCHQYQAFPGSHLPYPVLKAELFESVAKLSAVDSSPVLKRALRWFTLGVGAEHTDAQFQYFWLVIELVAEETKSIERVHDKCSACHEPLYCETCQTHPTHRPYPKQAIQSLFENTVKGDALKLFEVCNLVRNAIAHGDDLSALEESRDFLISDVVNHIGQLAWIALLNGIFRNEKARETVQGLSFLQTNMYVRQILTMTAHLRVFSSDPDNPKISEIAKPELSIHVSDKPPELP